MHPGNTICFLLLRWESCKKREGLSKWNAVHIYGVIKKYNKGSALRSVISLLETMVCESAKHLWMHLKPIEAQCHPSKRYLQYLQDRTSPNESKLLLDRPKTEDWKQKPNEIARKDDRKITVYRINCMDYDESHVGQIGTKEAVPVCERKSAIESLHSTSRVRPRGSRASQVQCGWC